VRELAKAAVLTIGGSSFSRFQEKSMPLEAAGYVTDVPYGWTFIPDLAPAWLDHVATVSGFAPPSRDQNFAWCDLGCGQGLTAAILAATHPAGRFCGIDFMATHIENARRLAAEAGIQNVEFHTADFAAAAETDFGGFDYIVAHGIYSWVDEQTQSALRHFIDRHLRPGGLAYVSYYAIPSRAADLPVQRLARALGLTFSGDSASRCASAIEIVNKLTQLNAPALAGSPMAVHLNEHFGRTDRARNSVANLAYLSHELMSEHWQPLCVTDVRAAMRSIGLSPAGSTKLIENYDSFVLGEAAREILATIADPDARELARDFLVDQSFRHDVYIRRGRPLDESERRAQLLTTCFALTRPVNTTEYKIKTPAGQLRFDNSTARNIVAAVACGPRVLADICTEFELPPQDAVANALVLSAAGALRPVERSWSAVGDLNEAINRRNVRFLALPCGTALLIDDDALLSAIKAGQDAKNEGGRIWRDFLANYGI
jgi:SAM-dependent methyltransferase